MSIQAVAWVLEHSHSQGYRRLVLIALANHANDTGECWPAQRTLAKEAGGISPGTANACVRDLIELGELAVVEPGSPRRSARYRLLFPERSAAERSARPEPNAARGPGETLSPVAQRSADERWAREPNAARALEEAQRAPQAEQNRQESSGSVNPPTPAERGPRRSPRADGTNPRAVGTNPRANDPRPVTPVPVYPSIEETRARLAADAEAAADAVPMPVELRRRIGKAPDDVEEAS